MLKTVGKKIKTLYVLISIPKATAIVGTPVFLCSHTRCLKYCTLDYV